MNKKILIALGLSCFIATNSIAAAMLGPGARQAATQGFRQMARRGVQTAAQAVVPVTETALTVVPQASKGLLGRFKEMATAKGFNALDAALCGSAVLGSAVYFGSQPAQAQELSQVSLKEQQAMALLNRIYADETTTFEQRQELGAELRNLLATESMPGDLRLKLMFEQARLKNEQEKRLALQLALQVKRQKAEELAAWRAEDKKFMEAFERDLEEEAYLNRTIRSADSLAQRAWSSVPSRSQVGTTAYNVGASLWNSMPSRESLSGYIPSMDQMREAKDTLGNVGSAFMRQYRTKGIVPAVTGLVTWLDE